jgi:trk system potassium uptake protein TrkA
MRIVILGCGRVGSALAYFMDREGHEVVIIDRESSAFRRIPPGFKGQTIRGLGIDEAILRQAGIERADCFAAVTNGDNTNIMAAQMAKVRFKVPKVVARVYDPIRAGAYRELGIDTICTTVIGAGLIQDFLLGRPWRPIEEYTELAALFEQQ